MTSQTLPQALALARHSASARLDRLPITSFHRRIMWLLGFVFFYELGDVYSLTVATILARQFRENQRGLANSVGSVAQAGGPAAATFAGGLLIARLGWRPFFILLGLTNLLWLIPWFRWTPRSQSSVSAEPKLAYEGILRVVKRPAAWATCCGLFCGNYVLYLLLTWLPFYLVHERHFSLTATAKIGGAAFLCKAAGALASRWLSDAWIAAGATPTLARKTPLCFGLMCSGILLLIASVSADRSCVIVLLAGSACLGLGTPQLHAISQTLAGPQLAGTWVSLMLFTGNFAGIMGPIVTGFVVDRTGQFFWAFVLTALIACIGTISYGFFAGPVKPIEWGDDFRLAPASKPQRVVLAGTAAAGLTFFTGPAARRLEDPSNLLVSSTVSAQSPQIRFRTFVWLALLLVGLAIPRSAISTRLDSFTIDEAYHIAAGVSYVKYGDFRINPEHPPLVKLWVGSFIAATGFHMERLRQFSDKPDERTFTETLVYRSNDPDSVQRRARIAMYTLNGLLLIFLALAIERAFNPVVALGALLFLVIDPTVAAHWPVVMTDLPVALLSATAIVLATRAFRSWIPLDLAFCSLFLGLALTAKHSAPVVLLAVGAVGACLTLFQPLERSSGGTRWKKLAKTSAVMAGALIILWGSYLFRFSETPTGHESFNRSLVDKIKDVDTPTYHAVLTAMAATHVVPRAYLWGFADTIHSGMEGRPFPQLIFGRIYINKGPKYFFPAIIAVKLPIGLSVLSLAGLFLFFARRLPEWNLSAGIIVAAIIVFLLVLMNGATYAGVRHALPVVALISVFAGIFVQQALLSRSKILKAIALVGFVAAMLSAIPVMRPWEYFNEFVGTRNAYKYFGDEGVDLGQRTKELSKYYFRVLKPAGEIPEVMCYACTHELEGRGVDFVGRDMQRDLERIANPVKTETIASSPQWLTNPYLDLSTLTSGEPVERYGNLFIFKGTYNLPGLAAGGLYWYGIEKLYAEKPDEITAERSFQRSVDLYPSVYFYHIELANLLLKRGARDAALHEYQQTLLYAPADPKIRQPIEAQIQLFAGDPSAKIPYLRNPFME